jgi:UDP-N-acetylmuramoyl-tripeptide--D-alanyl-D-alanine ligase
LKDARDGHEFVSAAFSAGAAAALVRDDYARQEDDRALVRVADPLMALEALARAARGRLAPEARVIAVTGSAGKTGTKEMLRACLSRCGPTHASEKSYNNHWGVPLTLARMPAAMRYAILEIGMNHAGEIRPLSKLARPHAAIITTVEAVHLEHFESVEAIADAKAEIFEGLEPGGVAIIKHANPHAARLRAKAEASGCRVVTFGFDAAADASGDRLAMTDETTRMDVHLSGRTFTVTLATPGRHIAENALAVAAAIDAAGADPETALAALAELAPPLGRGQRTKLKMHGGESLLIDESYNANPASIRAALATLATARRDKFPRRIAVLGDMLELGPDAPRLHRELSDAVIAAGVDLVIACGAHMKGLYDALPQTIRGRYVLAADELSAELEGVLRAGDVIMIKASNGTRLGPVAEALRQKFATALGEL